MRSLRDGIVFDCISISVVWCCIVTSMFAMDGVDLRLPESLGDLTYSKFRDKPSFSPRRDSRTKIQSYLKMPLQERRNPPSFVTFPIPLDHDLPDLDSFKIMKRILQSEIETWPESIQDIFNTEPSHENIIFWQLISEMSDCMSTPVLQKSYIIISKEYRKRAQEKKPNYFFRARMFKMVLNQYEDTLKKHVSFLKEKKKPEKVSDIFTRNEQEKLGEYGIHLEEKWSQNDEAELYRAWASHMGVYMGVQGAVKALLEAQAVQVSWIKFNKRYSLECFKVPSGTREPFEDALSTHCQALTKNLINSIESSGDKSWLEFWTHQKKFNYGIHDPSFHFEHRNTKKALVFWARYMDFYLELKSRESSRDWYYLMDYLIVNDTNNHLDIVVQQFLINPGPSDTQKSLIVRFLEFFLKKIKSGILREFAEQGLETMIDAPTHFFPKCQQGVHAAR